VRRLALLASTLALAACRGDERAPPPTATAAPVIATSADPAGRTIVAEVNGQPVFGDCVAAQAAADGIDRDAALARCIDFELLAQEAIRRGLLADQDVLATRRTEMVRALVETEFAPTLDDPSDISDEELRRLWDRIGLHRRYNRPELRRATYCRAPVAEGKTPKGSPEDEEARKLAESMYAALSTMRDLEPKRFAALCWMVSGGKPVKTTATPTRPFLRDGRNDGPRPYARPFAEAAFSASGVGGVSRPTRTNWGWDVVLVTEVLPAQSRAFEEVAPEVREELLTHPETAIYRNAKFEAWIGRYLRAARVELFPDNLPDDHALAQTSSPEADR
jgi:hypothetical protein